MTVEDLDTIVEASIGPRWAVAGPFKSYNHGGGVGGLSAWFKNLSGSVQEVWDQPSSVSFEGTAYDRRLYGRSSATDIPRAWADDIVDQTTHAYGIPTADDLADRDRALKSVLHAVSEHRGQSDSG